MDLKDATLMVLSESAGHSAVASIARSACDQIVPGGAVDYRVPNDLLGEASGKGVLRAIQQKYSATAYEAMITPICQEIGRQAPIRSRRQPQNPEDDPLTASAWLPR